MLLCSEVDHEEHDSSVKSVKDKAARDLSMSEEEPIVDFFTISRKHPTQIPSSMSPQHECIRKAGNKTQIKRVKHCH